MASNLSSESKKSPPPSVAAGFAACRRAFIAVALFSGVINILMLTGPFFMLQVYDRVLASRSVPTLVVLLGLVCLLFAFQAVLDIIRARLLTRIGERFDGVVRPLIFRMIARPEGRSARSDGLQPLRDLDSVRGFLGSAGPAAIFDVPWVPVYLAIVFALHPMLGLASLAGALILCIFAAVIELSGRKPSRAIAERTAHRNAVAETARLHGDYLGVMGMLPRFERRFVSTHDDMVAANRSGSDVAGGLGALSRVFRMLLQSLILGLGAWLVIQEQMTAGVMIAASIIASRALAPIEAAVAHWRPYLASRQAYRRLTELGAAIATENERHLLPAPRRDLQASAMAVRPPGVERPVFQGAQFTLKAGDALAVIGPSGSGKSSFARGLVGLWPTNRGGVRLDGATLDQWRPEDLGPHIGYLAQDVDLYDGTVAENIARFTEGGSPDEVLLAARRAGVHDLIVKLPAGYDTQVGPSGLALSGGQRQRIALARALYRLPFLIVLDEPNSNLDAEGETALARAIRQCREAGSIVVVISHRPSVLAAVDQVMVVAEGRVTTFGPKDEVLGRALKEPVLAGGKIA
jgi:PrtD family type I secretion system ABC transporter